MDADVIIVGAGPTGLMLSGSCRRTMRLIRFPPRASASSVGMLDAVNLAWKLAADIHG